MEFSIEIGDMVRLVRIAAPHRHPDGKRALAVGDIVEVAGFYKSPVSHERVLVYWRVEDIMCYTSVGGTGTDCTFFEYVERV